MGKLSKSDIAELCPSIGIKSVNMLRRQYKILFIMKQDFQYSQELQIRFKEAIYGTRIQMYMQ